MSVERRKRQTHTDYDSMCSKAKDVTVNKKNTIGYENNFLNLFILNIRELEDTLLKTKGFLITIMN